MLHHRLFCFDKEISFQEELAGNLRNSMESLELLLGKNVVSLLGDGSCIERITDIRLRLAKEGMLMPVLRIRDDSLLKDNQFMILAYQNVLYSGDSDGIELDDIMNRLEFTIRDKYYEIINTDIVKVLTDNLKIKYPALIENIVPEKISYGLLTLVLKRFMMRGNGIVYLPRIIELIQYCLLDEPDAKPEDIVEAVVKGIEREDNFWVYMNNS